MLDSGFLTSPDPSLTLRKGRAGVADDIAVGHPGIAVGNPHEGRQEKSRHLMR